ncbi:MAG: threonine aldolase, partial [Pseudonocardiales bacterium]|nr:threonine aldolase [Pseudonocardiales bacterium]
KAARLATGLADRGWRVSEPATNIVLLTAADLPSMLQRLEQSGVLAGPMGNQVRFVTHVDVSADDIDTVLDRVGPVDTGVAAPRRPA